MGTNTSKFRLALTGLTLVVLLLSVFAAVGRAAGTHSATEPTWYYRGVVTNDTGVAMKHVTVVYDPDGLQGVAGTPKFMMWWGTGTAGQLFATTSNDGVNWSGTGTSRAPLSVTFPSTTVPVYHPEVIYDRLGFDKKKSAGVVHFKMWFYDSGVEDYNWMRYAESADGFNWTVFEDSPCVAPACTNPSSKNYLEFSGGSGNEISVLYRRGGTGIIVNGADQEYVGYQAMNSLVGISTDGAWFFGVGGQGGGPTDVCREMVIAGDNDVVKYRAWDDLPSAGDLTSWDSATGLNWNSPAAGNPPVVGTSWSSLYGAMAVVVVGDQYYMYDTLKSDNYSVGLLVASFGPPTVVWVDDSWTSQADVDAFDPNLIWQYDAFSSVQGGVGAVAGGGTVNVRPGAYYERVTIHKPVDLRGAQFGVDPTAAGARTNPADESIIDVTPLGYANPDIAVEIVAGVSGVTIDGFTLIGDPTNTLADTSVVRCWASDVTIRNNILDGKYDVLYKGGDTFTVDHNRMVVNKVGVTVQPSPATNVTVSGNVLLPGPTPASDAAAIYMALCNQCSVTGNTATGFVNSNGLGGNSLSHLVVSGNVFTGNKKGVNIWGNSTYITISDNDLSSSREQGINVKGQDIEITGNKVNNTGGIGISIDRHVIDTQRVRIFNNDISGNTSYGVWVNTSLVAEVVNASGNWWGANDSAGVAAEVSANVDYTPWLDSGGDTSPDPGFQGDFTTLHVDDDSPQTGTTGRIQEGINLVEGSTVYVAPGTYNESLAIQKSVNVVGAGASDVHVTGGIQVGGSFDGLTLEGMYLTGDAPGYKNDVIDTRPTTGPVSSITIRNCVLDGENVDGRGAFYGNNVAGNWTWEGNEIKNFTSWYLIDNTGSSHDVPYALDTVTWDNNHVHNVGGTVAIRGKIDEPTNLVVVKNSEFDQFVDNSSNDGWIWAAMEINNASMVQVYDNVITGVPQQDVEGEALQLWSASPWTVDIHDNSMTGNYAGIYIWGLLPDDLWSGGDTPLYVPAGSVYQNNIYGNEFFGLWISDWPPKSETSSAIGGPLNAECNWWGDLQGPAGGSVSGNVDFQPWLMQEARSECDCEGPLTQNVDLSTVPVNTPVALTANVDDTGRGDTVIASAEYSLDGGTFAPMQAQDESFDSVSETVIVTIPGFADAGIHEVCVRGTDAAGNTGAEECVLLAVYDPAGGFVTGGGWIWSPAGAYFPDTALTGKATFGFVSKYKKGAQVPEGQTEFVFQVANLDFHSTSYEWLVVAGAKAMYKGSGTINGAGTYKFMLTALDADVNGNDSFLVDRFRIKIWTEDGGVGTVVYDNGLAADEQNDNATTEIGGGSIVIHTGRK